MTQHSSMHVYLTWAKERIDEMDATSATLEGKVGEMQAETKVTADQLIAELGKAAGRVSGQGEGTGQSRVKPAGECTKPELQSRWNQFEAQVKTDIESLGKQVQQQQATFQGAAAAQMKAWRETADSLRDVAGEVATARRADIDAVIAQMKAAGSEAEARLQKLKQGGAESWTAFGTALAESRKAFDLANQARGPLEERQMSDDVKRSSGPHINSCMPAGLSHAWIERSFSGKSWSCDERR